MPTEEAVIQSRFRFSAVRRPRNRTFGGRFWAILTALVEIRYADPLLDGPFSKMKNGDRDWITASEVGIHAFYMRKQRHGWRAFAHHDG
jgi:hypothetical protein